MKHRKEALEHLEDLKSKCDEVLTKIRNLEDDPFFVVYVFNDTGFGNQASEFYDWFYENDIVGKLEHFDFSISGVLHLNIAGFRFKDTADATAFKLRWT